MSHSLDSNARQYRYLPFAILALVASFLISVTFSQAVQVADSAEMVAAACVPGVAHPPGYPLYTLVGYLFCKLPFLSQAGRLSLLSAVSSIGTVLLLFAIGRRLTGRTIPAFLGSALLLCTPQFWRYSSLPEVFTLNLLLCAGIVYGALRVLSAEKGREGRRWLSVTALVGGMALANHHSAIWLFPLGIAAVVFPWRGVQDLAANILVALVAVVVGLSPYLYLILADPNALPHWGDTTSAVGLWHHFSRGDYGMLSLSLGGKASGWANLTAFAFSAGQALGWVFVLPVLLGWGLALRNALRPTCRNGSGALRAFYGCVALLPLLAGPVFLLMFNIQPSGIGLQVVERFYLLPLMSLCLCSIVAFAALQEGLSPKRAQLWLGVVGVLLVINLMLSVSKADVSENYVVEDYAANCLNVVPENALILGTGDARLFGITYTQEVLGLRRDVHYVDVRMLLYPWYVAQHKRRWPAFSYDFREGNVATLALIRNEMARGIPVFLTNAYNRAVEKAFIGIPHGPLRRLVPEGARPPGISEVWTTNQQLFAKLARRGRLPDPSFEAWEASLLETYSASAETISLAFAKTGNRPAAIAAWKLAQKWAPWLGTPKWIR